MNFLRDSDFESVKSKSEYSLGNVSVTFDNIPPNTPVFSAFKKDDKGTLMLHLDRLFWFSDKSGKEFEILYESIFIHSIKRMREDEEIFALYCHVSAENITDRDGAELNVFPEDSDSECDDDDEQFLEVSFEYDGQQSRDLITNVFECMCKYIEAADEVLDSEESSDTESFEEEEGFENSSNGEDSDDFEVRHKPCANPNMP